MAGAGYKLFSTGDVLSASDVNTYLQQQTVMVFASAAARTTALASVLAEGMVTYLKDTDVVEIYTGAAWVSLDDPNAIQNSIVDAKGDIITATADNTPARLALGTTGQVLKVNTSTSTGLEWAAASSGAVTQIADTTLASAAADITFSSIPSTYNHLMIVISGFGTSVAANGAKLFMQFNGASGATDYSHSRNVKYGTAGATVTIEGAFSDSKIDMGYVWCGAATANCTGAATINILDYKSTTIYKRATFFGGASSDAPGAGAGGGAWKSTSAVTSVKITTDATNLGIGTRATLYGLV